MNTKCYWSARFNHVSSGHGQGTGTGSSEQNSGQAKPAMARSGGALRFRDVRQNGCGETRDGLPFPWRHGGRRERVLGEGPTWTNGDGWFAVRVRRDSDKDTRVAGLGRHSCRCPWPRARRSQHPRPCVSAPRRRRADRRVCNPHCSMARSCLCAPGRSGGG